MFFRQNLQLITVAASIVCLTGCAKSVDIPTLYECPAPPAVELPSRPNGHMGSLPVVDWTREVINRLTLQVDLLNDTVDCYRRQVRQGRDNG